MSEEQAPYEIETNQQHDIIDETQVTDDFEGDTYCGYDNDDLQLSELEMHDIMERMQAQGFGEQAQQRALSQFEQAIYEGRLGDALSDVVTQCMDDDNRLMDVSVGDLENGTFMVRSSAAHGQLVVTQRLVAVFNQSNIDGGAQQIADVFNNQVSLIHAQMKDEEDSEAKIERAVDDMFFRTIRQMYDNLRMGMMGVDSARDAVLAISVLANNDEFELLPRMNLTRGADSSGEGQTSHSLFGTTVGNTVMFCRKSAVYVENVEELTAEWVIDDTSGEVTLTTTFVNTMVVMEPTNAQDAPVELTVEAVDTEVELTRLFYRCRAAWVSPNTDCGDNGFVTKLLLTGWVGNRVSHMLSEHVTADDVRAMAEEHDHILTRPLQAGSESILRYLAAMESYNGDALELAITGDPKSADLLFSVESNRWVSRETGRPEHSIGFRAASVEPVELLPGKMYNASMKGSFRTDGELNGFAYLVHQPVI